MDNFDCPFCGKSVAISKDTLYNARPAFNWADGHISVSESGHQYLDSTINITFLKCPSCNEYTISLRGLGDAVKNVNQLIRPNSLAKQYPDYIPQPIRDDYKEACAIVNLSPKASATLARRCLQGMIRDYWGISKRTLNDEISAIKDQIQPDLWSAIDALRKLGNIGAHMEKDTNIIVDIEPDEANKLIKLIELLMKEWYINRYEREQLFASILATNEQKQDERKANS